MRLKYFALFGLLACSLPCQARTLPGRENAHVSKVVERQYADASKRADLRAAFARYRRLEPVIRNAARKHGVPPDLAAMAFVESRFRSLDEAENRFRCAGLWQLDRETARSLGLVVTAQRDDRLDPALASDASMQYLRELHDRFGDWSAAVVAYNIGETKLAKVMRQRGERDVWKLVGDRRVGKFLVRVAAAATLLAEGEEALVSAERTVPLPGDG